MTIETHGRSRENHDRQSRERLIADWLEVFLINGDANLDAPVSGDLEDTQPETIPSS